MLMKYHLFATHSNPLLPQEIIKKSNKLIRGKCKISHYKDGEILVHLDEKVKDKKVFVLGSTYPPAENVLELIILINTLKENGAKEIVVLIPYFGYGKQDRIKYSGDAMSAKLMAEIIQLAGAKEIIALDLHSQLVKKYFANIINLNANQLLSSYFADINKEEYVVVAPDMGGVTRAKKFAKELGIKNVAIIEKSRPKIDESKVVKMTGKVKDKNCVIVDDLSQTGGTLIKGAKYLKTKGAKDVYVVLTHLVATGPVIKNLGKDRNIKKIVTTNSIDLPKKIYKSKKFEVKSCADVFIKNI